MGGGIIYLTRYVLGIGVIMVCRVLTTSITMHSYAEGLAAYPHVFVHVVSPMGIVVSCVNLCE